MTSPPEMSRLRRGIFTLLMLLLPLLLLAGMEGLLRIVGYGEDYPLFIPVPGFPEYRYQNPEVARRYFGYQKNVPNSNFDVFRARKDSSTVRIFVQGGSSAAGYPYYHGGAFSRMLEQRLQQTYPDRTIEVVNTAMAAVNSYTLLDLADEILREKPDAVLIYAGHNEFYGALGVGSAESVGRLRPLVLLYLKLRRFRLVQALRDGLFALRRALSPPAAERRGTLMSRMVREKQIPLHSALYHMGLQQFRANLHALLSKYEQAGVPVFLGTLVSNEGDQAPFEGEPLTDVETYRALLHEATRSFHGGHADTALHLLSRAEALDSLAADAFYLEGRIRRTLGDTLQAREAFQKARDRDMLRFRAPGAFNAILREEAREHGGTLVPVEETFARHSSGGIVGNSLILEHLHPNLTGYFWMADAFYDAMLGTGKPLPWRPPVPDAEALRDRLVTPVDSLYGHYRIRVLMADWPFRKSPAPVNPMDTLQPRSIEEQLALNLFRGKMRWMEAQDALRHAYESRGHYREALRASMAILQEYPFLPGPYITSANLLLKMQRYREALTYYEAALDLEPSAYAHQMAGAIYLALGIPERAREHLLAALRLDPDNVQARYNLSGYYLKTGQPDSARIQLTRLLQSHPEHAEARRLLRQLMQ